VPKKIFLILFSFFVLILFAANFSPSAYAAINYVTKWGSQGSGNGQFEYGAGIALDSNENVFVR